MKQEKVSFIRRPAVQTTLISLLCILLGLLVGFGVLLLINPAHAFEGIITILKNFMNYPSSAARMKYLGNTLVKTAPLLMCALSIQFCYKAGLFNIGAAGQYVAGACACLYAALGLHWNWFMCMLAGCLAGALFAVIVGFLKAYCSVNEVIAGIMLNWISLYFTNMTLSKVKEVTSPYTYNLAVEAKSSLLPNMGLDKLFTNNQYVTIAVPLSVLCAILVYVVLNKTTFGYELRATGFNKEAARYAGMKEKRNTILTLAIGGGLAGLGATFLYLSGFEQWMCTQSSVPGMGFNGIAATFLGGLHPIGTIFSSYFIQHITTGGAYLDKSIYPGEISSLITALIIYFCGFVLFFRTALQSRLAKKVSTVNANAVDDKKTAEGGKK